MTEWDRVAAQARCDEISAWYAQPERATHVNGKALTDIAALLAANQRLKDENERLTRLADLAAEWARQGRVTCAQCGMRFWGDFCGPTHATIAALLDSHDTAEVGS